MVHVEIEKLKVILIKNDYPLYVINREISRYMLNKFKQEKQKDTCDKLQMFLVLPYIVKQGELIKSKLVNLISRFYPHVDIRVMFKTPKELRSMVV
jgi:hypothetical protein